MASRSLVFSSGDLVADRRLELARDYAAAGEAVAAAELCEQALELAPDWAVGWFALGEFREVVAAIGGGGAAGADDTSARRGAIEAYRRAIELDPDDHCGATLRLARLGATGTPAAPPQAHVRDLFDGYADRYETSLVTALGYRGPELIDAALSRLAAGRRFAAALDLGCGTGLMAPVIRSRAGRLEGIDLAPAMVAKARAGGLYDRLTVGEIVAEMAALPAAGFDLIIAGDVFCYLGDLAPVLAAAARVAAPGALIAFTTEAVGDEEIDGDVVLRPSLRYAHRASAVERMAVTAGFSPLSREGATLRRDRGVDIAGTVAVFTRT